MKTKPSAEYVLLGALMSGPRHGYEILQFINTTLESTWYVSTSQLYLLLKRLKQEGLIRSRVEAQDNRPPKRVFSLTSEGEKVFLDWLHNPSKHVRDLRIEFLAKLFFFDRLSLKGGSELIKVQVQVLEEIREKIEQRQKNEKEKNPYNKLVFGFKMATVEATLEWLHNQAKPFIQRSPGG